LRQTGHSWVALRRLVFRSALDPLSNLAENEAKPSPDGESSTPNLEKAGTESRIEHTESRIEHTESRIEHTES
jgi:hypothetical protein